MSAPPRVLLVDNYDSFTYNIAQEMGELGAAVEVARHDAFTLDDVEADAPDGIVISPGPGVPADAGISNDVIRRFAGEIPLLGVCLGHQCIAEVYGATIVPAPELVHGKTSAIHHDARGVFSGLPQSFDATRYHSLVADPATIPDELVVTARTGPGSAHPDLIMGVRHATLPVEGVQFHPESILTRVGMTLLGNFLASLPVRIG
ncbi:aminodeoxychorismate/anthranilate synthase component II [Euzebya sp.]|uniref:anthranilate synthase component II n=1 Tax=Euzebya sp. TaxID=1971409 RepID=UPI00351420AD